jgi:hypothetical protein
MRVCPRCGTQNPDGNSYCQACGTLLSAPVAATLGAFAGPPPGPPPGLGAPAATPAYQSPYYAPAGPTQPVHRTRWTSIIASVVVLTVVMAGAGAGLALLGNRPSPTGSSAGILDVPSPTPGLTPSPVASPTSTTQTGLESNDGFSLNVPGGWTIESKDNETMVLSDPGGEGSVTVSSGVSDPSQTAQNNKDTVDAALKNKYPDTRECPNTSPATGTLSGVAGISWRLCFTLTGGSSSFPAAASMFAGANSTGSVFYLVMILTSESSLDAYVTSAKPVIQSVQWKLS